MSNETTQTEIPPEVLEAERRRQEKAKAMAGQFSAPIPKDVAFAEELRAAEQRFKELHEQRLKELSECGRMESDARDTEAKWLLSAMHLPKRHARKKWTDLDFTGDWATKLTTVKGKIGKGFLVALVGVVGNGKTQFGVEILREAAQQLRTGLFTSATAFFMDIKAAYKEKLSDAEKDVIARYCKPQVLVIDEMSKRGETEWENRLLFHLINERYNEELDTVLLANQDADQFEDSVGPAINRRLTETGGLIACNWGAFV